jgi:Xaa-Pro aminopeptidase
MSTRAERLIAALDGAGVDLMLVTNLINVRYLTGYTGSNGLALIGPSTRVFLTDFRYTEQVEQEVYSEFERITASQALTTEVIDHLPEGALQVGYESETVTVDEHDRIREQFPERVELVAVKGLVERMRAVKDEQEIELIAGRRPRGAHRARARAGTRARHAAARRGVTELRLDRRRRCSWCSAACQPARRQGRERPAGRDRLGCQVSRVLLGLHAYRGRR